MSLTYYKQKADKAKREIDAIVEEAYSFDSLAEALERLCDCPVQLTFLGPSEEVSFVISDNSKYHSSLQMMAHEQIDVARSKMNDLLAKLEQYSGR